MIPCGHCGREVEGLVVDETYNLCPKCLYTGVMAALELHDIRTERFERETGSPLRRLWRRFRDTWFYRPMGIRT